MTNFPAGPAFSSGVRVFSWTDVVLAAILRRDWTSFADGVRRRLALAASAEAEGVAPSDEELDAAAGEFRYERDLITAEDMEAWLDRQGLTVDEWMAFVERSLLESRAGAASESDALAATPPDEDSLSECLSVEAICSGTLARFAELLAARVAIDDRASADPVSAAAPSPEEIDRGVEAFSSQIESSGLPDLEKPHTRERLAELVRMELVFQSHRLRLASGSALRAEIEAHRLDWIRIDLQGIAFADEASAREALLCLREDGETLEEVAASARLRMREETIYLSEIDPVAKPDLLSARPGDLVGPLAFGERFHVFLLRDKTMPSEKDPDVRRRAEDALIAKLVENETDARIHWLDPR